jgi:putative membrane protein
MERSRILSPAVMVGGRNFLKGGLIGIANTIPGVSGGTIAVVTGIYDRTIAAISGFFKEHGGWTANLGFLLPILGGAGVGIVAFARIIDFLNVSYPHQTAFFFLGLIVGSLPYLIRVASEARFRMYYALPLVLCLTLVVVMSIVSEPDLGNPRTELSTATALMLLLSGFVSAAAMIVPGVSGSFVLLLLGTYSTIIRAVRDFNIPALLLVALGAVLGLILVAKGIQYLLEHYHAPTYYGIIGLVLGSLAALWPGFTFDLNGLLSVGAFGIGLVLAMLLGSRRGPSRDAAAAPNSEPRQG